jgi:hypothetical protein
MITQDHSIRVGDSFRHSREIFKPWGEIDHVVSWCKHEARDEWRWQLAEVSSDQRPGRYIFYFDDERDYLAFLMKWS